MTTFNQNNLKHIRELFQSGTGVELPSRRRVRRPARTAALLAAALILCLTATAFACGLFSSLAGDELGLSATYEGEGIISILVENRSDKDLRFQPVLKLMRWTTGEEIKPLSDAVSFRDTEIPARSSGTMTIDLSAAYDMGRLEEPLEEDDWYYLVLTNNDFVFGQDWMCAVTFAKPAEGGESPAPAEPVQADGEVLRRVEESLRPYFETISLDIEDRRAMNAEYVQAYAALLDGFAGNIVSSVSPVLPGNRIASDTVYLRVDDPAPGVVLDGSVPDEEQYRLVGQQWRSCDGNFKLLATEGENALVLSAMLPLQSYPDAARELPLLYLFTYEKAAIDGQGDYAFVYGQLLTFEDLAPYRVYEDEGYVCYEVSGLVCSDLEEYARSFAAQNPDVRFDGQVWARVENIYTYYREHLGELISYR